MLLEVFLTLDVSILSQRLAGVFYNKAKYSFEKLLQKRRYDIGWNL
jgi:hypothetical protein